MNYTLSQLAKIIDAEVVGNPENTITHIFYDSRTIVNPENGIFIAIQGIHDGHIYMEDAYQKSIRLFICKQISVFHGDASYLIVKNPLEALQKWAAYHIFQYNFPTIGITGSNGKTIVKEWLYQCLWDQFTIVRSPKSFNSQIGLPLSLLQTESDNNFGIFEVGISKPGEMEKQEQVFHPQIGILTNILSAHSEYFTNKTELITEKIKLFAHSQTIIYNNDNKEVEKLIREKYPHKKLISFGAQNADVQLIKNNTTQNTTQIEISVQGEKVTFNIPFTDEASVQNILCVTAVLHSLGYGIEFMQEKILQLQSVSMRLELIKGNHNNLLINDTFNSDYISLEIALNFLFQQNNPKKILILSDILQCRTPEKEFYYKIADRVNAVSIDSIFLIGECLYKYQNLFNGTVHSFLSTQELINHLDNYFIKDAAILLKGARTFELEKVAAHLEAQSHDTIMEVNLHSLMMNINYFQSLLKPETKIIAMVKASSYGIGSFEVAEVLQYYHIDYLAVAIADEGALLRKKGIYLPIMVMNPEISSYDTVIDFQLEPEIYSFRVLEKFISRLKEKSISEKYPIHIKIDTGMHRLGFNSIQMEQLSAILKDNPFVKVKSVFSHFVVSDDLSEEEFTRKQARELKECHEVLSAGIGYTPFLHICNTTGVVNYPEYQFDAVRLGIGMYGYIDSEKALKNLENVVTLKTVISNLHHIKAGETVGYGRRFKAKEDCVIATLPVGYADGIRRLVGNEVGYVKINGQKAPIVGSVCMDMMMVNVTGIACKEGDPVIILGENPNLCDYANWCHTIPYEILTSISPRVKRIYYRE